MADVLLDTELRIAVDPDIYKIVDSYTRLGTRSEEGENARAKIQQQFGVKAFPSILRAIGEEKIEPLNALMLIKGVSGEDKELYDIFRAIAFMPKTYIDQDHSAINEALDGMVATAANIARFSEDADELSGVVGEKVRRAVDLERTQSLIAYSKRNFYSKREINKMDLNWEREKSKKIYGRGDRGYWGEYVIGNKDKSPGVIEKDEGYRVNDILERIRRIRLTKIKSGAEGYIIFNDETSRREMVEVGRKVCEYVHDRGIQEIIFVDRSARPGYITVVENWKNMYPGEKPPNIYFMNPNGFKSLGDIWDEDPELGFTEALVVAEKDDRPESPGLVRSKSEISKDLRKTYPELFSREGKHVLLFDTCVHSGESVKPMIGILTDLGLDVRLGVVSAKTNASGIDADLVIFDKTQGGGCHPFDRDRLVEKTYTSVHSLKSDNEEKRILSRQIRKEIRMALSEYYS